MAMAAAREADCNEASEGGEPEPAHANLHPDDPGNFFKLSEFLKIVMAHSLTDADVDRAEVLISKYCLELKHVRNPLAHPSLSLISAQLYGDDVIKPNHHYAMDVPECIRDFGPFVGFWTFLFERLNKILKSYNTANHAGGELEVSFFRECHRTILHSRLVSPILPWQSY
jgi:hypothetical protein